MGESVSVLVVDDSAFMRKMVTQMLSSVPGVTVLGHAANGRDALAKAEKLRPSVITLDVEMPEMDGVEALKEIVSRLHIPVVMLSSLTKAGAATTLRCLELGAFDFVAKPSGAISLDIERVSSELVLKVVAASRSRRFPIGPLKTTPLSASGTVRRRGVVVIGSSTGGPRALQTVIPALPEDLKVPVVVVQHMPAAFTGPLAARLNDASRLEVKEAEEEDRLAPGLVLVAPGGFHLEFDVQGKVRLRDTPPIHGVRPSIDVTLASLVRNFGSQMVAVLLTGMGADGAAGLKAVRNTGGATIAESEETCVIYGMPKAAVELGAVEQLLPLGEIASAIVLAVTGHHVNARAS